MQIANMYIGGHRAHDYYYLLIIFVYYGIYETYYVSCKRYRYRIIAFEGLTASNSWHDWISLSFCCCFCCVCAAASERRQRWVYLAAPRHRFLGALYIYIKRDKQKISENCRSN